MLKVGLLIRESDYPFFAKKINHLVQFDYVFSVFGNGDYVDPQKLIVGFRALVRFAKKNRDEEVCVVLFDVVPLAVRIALNVLSSSVVSLKVVFVQHGFFEIVGAKASRTLSWYVDNLAIAFAHIRYSHNVLNGFVEVVNYFQMGSWKAFPKFKEPLELDSGCFWDRASAESLYAVGGCHIKQSVILGSPHFDEGKIKFYGNDLVAYISQPLSVTNHCSVVEFEHLLSRISAEIQALGKRMIVIAHPKIPKEMLAGYEFTFLADVDEIKCSAVWGHFSSLLYSVPADMPIRLDCWGVEGLLEPVQQFKKQFEQRERVDGSAGEFEQKLNLLFKAS